MHYPKCPVCHYRTEAVNASSTSVDEGTEKANLETGNTRKVVQLSPNQDKAINLKIFKSYDIRGEYPEQLNEHTAEKIGIATVQFLKGIKVDVKNIVAARDIRLSSESLARSLNERHNKIRC